MSSSMRGGVVLMLTCAATLRGGQLVRNVSRFVGGFEFMCVFCPLLSDESEAICLLVLPCVCVVHWPWLLPDSILNNCIRVLSSHLISSLLLDCLASPLAFQLASYCS